MTTPSFCMCRSRFHTLPNRGLMTGLRIRSRQTEIFGIKVKVPTEQPLDGMDIIQHVVDKRPEQEQALYWRKARRETVWQSLRLGNWRGVRAINGNQIEAYLFNLDSDPSKKKDLKESMSDKFKELQAFYETWKTESRRNRRR